MHQNEQETFLLNVFLGNSYWKKTIFVRDYKRGKIKIKSIVKLKTQKT